MEVINKRGRKPKAKVEPEEEIETTPKKRGRKPKEKSYSVLKPVINEEIDNSAIILHLSVRSSDIEDANFNSILEYTPSINEPEPYEPENNFDFAPMHTTSENNTSNIIEEPTVEKDSIEIEIHQVINEDEPHIIDDEKVEHKEQTIKHQSHYSDGTMMLVKKNLLNIMFEFIDSKNKEWPKSTSIHCMWDCHQFDTIPCAIPVKYVNDKFFLFGCFCSFNCAMAYIFDQKTANKWEQYALLLLLYKKIYNTEYINLKIAPPRQSLKIFGGIFNIEQFRQHFVSNRDYNIVYPPMIAVIPKLEENIYEVSKLKYIPVNNTMMKEATLKLKRDKPVHSELTLESYMNLKTTS